ncbi:MAG: S-methyl-5'-thioadenosine phosphorylase [Acidobacteria bacterium]|nr:S-methyl-5'-thioadenosine phosphorylase [Acidobacteriota bacterium]
MKRRAKSIVTAKAEIGIMGGSGLYHMSGLERVREVRVATPFGKPSDAFMLGTLEGRRVAFLARHGRGHVLLPSEVNYRANIYGMKKLGVERIISVTAVGSLREDMRPLDVVLPTQFFDRTTARPSTFFGGGIVAHISFADPICPALMEVLAQACAACRVNFHRGGTYVCMEGPAFSTKAESGTYRAWGMDVIGMTNLQEAKLAREAEICYSSLAMVTDYDCWHPDHDAVTVAQIIDYLNRNVANAQRIIRAALASLSSDRGCKCGSALAHAILTDRKKMSPRARKKLGLLVGKYLK